MIRALVCNILVSGGCACAQIASITRLEAPAGYPLGLSIRGVSGNGEYVFGSLGEAATTSRLYRWSPVGGIEVLTGSEPNVRYSPWGASFDGHTIVGDRSPFGGFRWRSTTGALPFDRAQACSGDGEVIAGANLVWSEMFAWSTSGGFQIIDPLPFTNEFSFPGDISSDGTVVVGWRDGVQPGMPSNGHGFRWTAASGTVPLNFVANQRVAVSADGRTVVGTSVGGAGRWTQRDGVITVVPAANGRAISGDGWVIAGSLSQSIPSRAYIWDPISGMRNLHELLQSMGAVGIEQWRLDTVIEMSWDGRVIVGTGFYGGSSTVNGQWVATIPGFCYANCDGSTIAPTMNVADFTCFLRKFAQNDAYANCDNDGSLSVADFTCFLQRFAAGCP
jgi:hypothetical protein